VEVESDRAFTGTGRTDPGILPPGPHRWAGINDMRPPARHLTMFQRTRATGAARKVAV
jgi:hypothetical protein